MKSFDFNNISYPAGYALALTTVFIWSVTFVATKHLLGFLMPAEILFYRVLLAYAVYFIADPRPLPTQGRREEATLAAASACGVTLYFLLENTALSYSTPANVSLLCATSPLLTGLAAHFFAPDEKLSKRFAAGSVFCLTGISFVILNGRFILRLNPLGDIMALGAALSFAVFSVLVKGVKLTCTPVQTARKMLFYALVSFIPLFLTPIISLHPKELLNPSVSGSLLFLAICASAFCTWSWNMVIWTLGPVKANNLIYLIPPVTSLFSYIALGDKPTVFAITGGVLIMAGVYVSQKIK